MRIDTGFIGADVIAGEQNIHCGIDVFFQFVIMFDGMGAHEVRAVNVRCEYDKAACGEAFGMSFDEVV